MYTLCIYNMYIKVFLVPELLNSKANFDPLKYITFGAQLILDDLISSWYKSLDFQPKAYSSLLTFCNVSDLCND